MGIYVVYVIQGHNLRTCVSTQHNTTPTQQKTAVQPVHSVQRVQLKFNKEKNMSSYKELNNLINQSKKFFDKKYRNLSTAEQKELSNLSYKIKITREDLLKKAIQKQLAKQKAVEDYENNNLMKKLSRGE